MIAVVTTIIILLALLTWGKENYDSEAILSSLHTLLDNTLRSNDKLNDMMSRPAPTLPIRKPFICILVTGDGPDGPTTLGVSGEPGDFSITTDVRLTNVQVIIFADLREIIIPAIRMGNNCTFAGFTDICPIAKFKEWNISVKLTIRIERRVS